MENYYRKMLCVPSHNEYNWIQLQCQLLQTELKPCWQQDVNHEVVENAIRFRQLVSTSLHHNQSIDGVLIHILILEKYHCGVAYLFSVVDAVRYVFPFIQVLWQMGRASNSPIKHLKAFLQRIAKDVATARYAQSKVVQLLRRELTVVLKLLYGLPQPPLQLMQAIFGIVEARDAFDHLTSKVSMEKLVVGERIVLKGKKYTPSDVPYPQYSLWRYMEEMGRQRQHVQTLEGILKWNCRKDSKRNAPLIDICPSMVAKFKALKQDCRVLVLLDTEAKLLWYAEKLEFSDIKTEEIRFGIFMWGIVSVLYRLHVESVDYSLEVETLLQVLDRFLALCIEKCGILSSMASITNHCLLYFAKHAQNNACQALNLLDQVPSLSQKWTSIKSKCCTNKTILKRSDH